MPSDIRTTALDTGEAHVWQPHVIAITCSSGNCLAHFASIRSLALLKLGAVFRGIAARDNLFRDIFLLVDKLAADIVLATQLGDTLSGQGRDGKYLALLTIKTTSRTGWICC